MRTYLYIITVLGSLFLITSCSETGYKFKLDTTKKVTLGQKASVTFQQIEGKKIDSVQLYLNGKKLHLQNNTTTINTSNLGVGKHIVTALAFLPKKVKQISNSITVYAKEPFTTYTYKIVNEFKHDKKAYTQGLEFHNGFLYETTGRRGKSWLRKIDYKTGKVLQQKNLDKKYFGEGMTIFNNKIYWLTWQANKGFIYNLDTFEQIGEFNYNKSLQGWGLSHNNTHLLKTDGSNRIYFLNPETFEEEYFIQAYTHDLPKDDLRESIDKLNEIEFVDGKIYANRWITEKPVKSIMVIINPKTGAVEGIVNLKGLRNNILKTQKLDSDEVLNGVAYNPETKTFFVTGKHWGKLFEIKLVKQ